MVGCRYTLRCSSCHRELLHNACSVYSDTVCGEQIKDYFTLTRPRKKYILLKLAIKAMEKYRSGHNGAHSKDFYLFDIASPKALKILALLKPILLKTLFSKKLF